MHASPQPRDTRHAGDDSRAGGPGRAFLTGATGFIGLALTVSLLRRGWTVDALVRDPGSARARRLSGLGARLVPGDVLDAASMRDAMRGADAVLHNAGWYELGLGAQARERMTATNVRATEVVLSLAHELGAPRVVHVSSVVAYGQTGNDPVDETYERRHPYRSHYERTKAEAHAIALRWQRDGLPVVIVCPNAVYGPDDHSPFGCFLRLYLNRLMPPLAWSPDNVLSMVHVDDVAEGIALAAVRGRLGETYLLAGEPFTLREMFAWWAERPGGARPLLWLPAALLRPFFALLEPLERALGLPAFISRETVDGTVPLNYSNAKARRALGWSVRPAREGWLATIDAEIALMSRRRSRSLAARLNPLGDR
jgi:dihydroflavonol-4-reductase